MAEKFVYLMRGLPSCGKSFTAKRLAGEQGIVFETDEYFYLHVGDDPQRFDFRESLLKEAQDWNFQRFQSAVNQGLSPIVVDRGNSRNGETRRYAQYAVDGGFRVELAEPDSPWWQEIRVLLKYKQVTKEILDKWAEVLAEKSRSNHRVPVETIRRWMTHWKHDLTIEEILDISSNEDGA